MKSKENEEYKIYCYLCGEPHYLNGVVKLSKVKWACAECMLKMATQLELDHK